MNFEKIIIPPGWQDSFTKYPNGRTIFEALTSTITSVNEGIEEVNQKVNQGLLAIDQAETTIRNEITDSFNTLKLQLESEIDDLSDDLIADFGLLQSQVLTLIAGKADKTYVDDQDAALVAQLNEKALKTEVGLLSGLLTTTKTSIVNAINELFNSKANKVQEAWIPPTLLNGWTQNDFESADNVAYLKDAFGFVHLKGAVKNGTIPYIFSLPVGYRNAPYKRIQFAVATGGPGTGVIEIYNGEVWLKSTLSSYVNLDGIVFRAEG